MTTRKTRKLAVWLLAASLATGTATVGIQAFNPFSSSGAPSVGSIPTAQVVKGRFVKTINSVGELNASRSATLAAPYDGKVVQLLEEGARVEEGDPVIWLDTTSLVQDLEDEEARLALALKDLEAAREDYRLQELKNEYDLQSEQARVELSEQRRLDAEQKFETEKVLVEKRISAQSRLDEAQLAMLQASVELRNSRINLKKTEENLLSNLRVKQNAIDRAQLEVERIERRIEDLEDRIDKAVLRAPATGEVSYFRIWRSGTSAKIAEGDNVWPRLNLVEIPDRREMLALVPVNELDIAEVEPGQPATITMDALPGRSFTGTVNRKSIVPIDALQSRRGSSGGNGPREFEVRIRLDESDPQFFQGMTASVQIEVARVDDALMVPQEALTVNAEQLGVYRAGGSSPEFVEVSVVNANDRVVAVEGPLTESDRVYLRHPLVAMEEARSLGTQALRLAQQQMEALRLEDAERPRDEQPRMQPGEWPAGDRPAVPGGGGRMQRPGST